MLHRLLLPVLTTTAMLALTLSLGFWQIERLHWKQGLLAAIDHGDAVEPVALYDSPTAFSRVATEGTFAAGIARYGAEVRATPSGPAMGAHVLGVLERPGAIPVVVDRGWAPIDGVVEVPVGPVRVQGYIRPPETASWSAARDDIARHRFFTLNPALIGASLGLVHVAPYTLVVLGSPGSFPEPATALPRPPNDHLSYAITWFSLSAILLVVFIVFARQVLRRGAPR